MTTQQYLWAILWVILIGSLIVDLYLFRGGKEAKLKKVALVTSSWVMLALIFAGGIYSVEGSGQAIDFLTGYVIELSLSMDNVLVFYLIFQYLGIPLAYQHRVLFLGVVGAIVMRLIMIYFGVYLVTHFNWMFYIFGALLIIGGAKIFYDKLQHKENTEAHPHKSRLIAFVKRHFRFTDELPSQRTQCFSIIKGGKRYFTPLMLALILVEKIDLVFALDSIPAILAITQDIFIVFASNVFALLGLRSLYFLLVHVIERFVYLQYGLALVLIYVGFKMIGKELGYHIEALTSLLIIAGIMASSVIASLMRKRSL
jgi:tellurite resistance protein TerC